MADTSLPCAELRVISMAQLVVAMGRENLDFTYAKLKNAVEQFQAVLDAKGVSNVHSAN